MGQKREFDKMEHPDKPSSTSPFIPMFETFRKELDEHHDRRERIIKASRDITASSKKIIFSLQRVKTLNKPLPPFVNKSNTPHHETIQARYSSISSDLQGLNTHRYERNITGGNQEFMESLTFQHYLETQSLISYEEASQRLAALGGEGGAVVLSVEDYLLGVFDMVGELMRFAITNIATNSLIPGGEDARKVPTRGIVPGGGDAMEVDFAPVTAKQAPKRDVLSDLRQLRAYLEGLDVDSGSPFGRDVDKKMEVMRTCVEKVENAYYGLIIRGRERPKGWMPDVEDRGGRREEVEGY